MHDRALTRKFDRYRRRGDVAALGDVFDAVAPELARAAGHLVRRAVDVDDLVQATFLTALERAATFDARQRLVPWLMGILVRHAHAQRRDAARTPDPRRLEPREVDEERPDEVAARAEASEALADAVRGLPARYREVLEPLVLRGTPAAELAARLGRSPGTVRMQQSRGFELLRRALPAGAALGLAEALGGRGLGAVRAEVLAAASAAAPTTVAASAALLSTMTLTQKLVAGVAGLAALVGLATWRSGAADGPPAREVGALAPEPGGESSEAPLPSNSAPSVAAAPDVVSPRSSASGPATPRDTTLDASRDARAALAGARGRVLEEDGAPVAGIPVELVAVGLDALERASTSPLEPIAAPTAVIARAISDAEGAFELGGVSVHSHTALVVDGGGQRPYSRLLDEGLARGGVRELGDVVLPRAAPLAGRVVDERGAPIAGARVRVARTEGREAWLPYLGIDAGTPAHVGEGLLAAVIEAPPWLPDAARLLPVATARTDAEGRFLFPSAPCEGAAWFVDAPGFRAAFGAAPRPAESASASPEATSPVAAPPREVAVTLARGRSVRGRVLDATGLAVTGAEVRAGTRGTLGVFGPPFAPLVQSSSTDTSGDFVMGGLEAEGDLLLAARRRAGDAWTLVAVKDDGKQTVTLPARFDVEVLVVDTAGAPVDGARLALARPAPLDGLAPGAGLLDPWGAVASAEALGAGRYLLRDVPQGPYRLVTAADGYAPAEERLNVRARMKPVAVTLGAPRILVVRLVDAGDGRPIEGARLSALERLGSERVQAAAESDTDGLARLTLPAAFASRTAAPDADGPHLRVAHAAYGLRRVPLPSVEDRGEAVHTLALAPAGALRIVTKRSAKPAPGAPRVMAELDRPAGGDAYPHYLHRRFGLADADGVIQVDGLAPGTWHVALYERYLDGDPLALLDGFWPVHLGRVDVTVVAGETVTVDVPLRAPGATTLPEGSSSLVVRVTRDGAPVTDRTVTLNGLDALVGGSAAAALDERGEATFERLPGGAYWAAMAKREMLGGVPFDVHEWHGRIEVAEGEARVHEVQFHLGGLRVQVLDERGAPVPGVEVAIDTDAVVFSRIEVTDAGGSLELRDVVAGATRISVKDEQHGVGHVTAEVLPGELVAVDLPLVRGVPCAGTVTTPPFEVQGARWVQLELRPKDGLGPARRAVVELGNDPAPFRVLGVRPGAYEVHAVWNAPTGRLAPLELVVPPGGSDQLTLRFSLE